MRYVLIGQFIGAWAGAATCTSFLKPEDFTQPRLVLFAFVAAGAILGGQFFAGLFRGR